MDNHPLSLVTNKHSGFVPPRLTLRRLDIGEKVTSSDYLTAKKNPPNIGLIPNTAFPNHTVTNDDLVVFYRIA